MPSSRAAWAVALGVLLAPAPASGEVVERIVAVVDGRPLLLSELKVMQQVRGDSLEDAREALVDEWLMFKEAGRLPQLGPTAEEETAAAASVRLRAPAAVAPTPEDLRRVARRQATILKYVAFRFRPQARVEEAAVRAAYTAAHPSGEPSFEAVAPELRTRLLEQDLDRRIEEWVKELRQAAVVRYNP